MAFQKFIRKYKSIYLVSFELVFMLSSSKIIARFDVEVNMLLILRECEKNFSTCSATIFRTLQYSKIAYDIFLRLEHCLCVHGQLSTIKRQKATPVINYNNSVNILAAVELNPHVSQRELANTSGVGQFSIQQVLNTNFMYYVILAQAFYKLLML